ncbi:hypothetical protein SAMD00019534_026990 [Acytostelium subglobosum LB1]|uniref:hypothetical protein n=1 Tax=Acytostelium subglobosum LB1 TaxID=1410327 RepID=UPI0006449CAA|nr:hypothetical protein SAMD00019534_026990 [Acytostelium subglobosum LB1]GAM19524.1 hypothetical protein SAMD00019534_026990 [Acytostelium subglobosum LB1]|eukprot:XP_012757451.1 hypothetical protein SAMD00019534_026990 [Acytostelium subglobosum LB1]
MGICKCKKRSDDFCFVHKKFICEGCVVTDHSVCHVGSYVDWLNDSDFEEPVCGICKGELKSDNCIRLMCYDLFHPECIDVYACSLPPTTAMAGYACPTCNKAILPSNERQDALSVNIRKTFAVSSWAEPFLGLTHKHSSMPSTSQTASQVLSPGSDGSGVDRHDIMSFTGQINPSLLEETPPLSHLNSNPYGLAIRKQQAPTQGKSDTIIQVSQQLTPNMVDDEEDKYNKKSVLLKNIIRFKQENKFTFYLIVILLIVGVIYVLKNRGNVEDQPFAEIEE